MRKPPALTPVNSVAMLAALFMAKIPAAGAEKVLRLHEIAVAHDRPDGAPKLSDVCFSSRWKHPSNNQDPHDSFRAAAAFHATRFVWVYTYDKQFIDRAKELGYGFSCTLNSMLPDFPKGGRSRGRIQDLDGNLVTAPWMRTWKDPAWGCVNSPRWRASYLAWARKALDAGTDTIQMDDPPINLAAVSWGGCFCDPCMVGFRAYVLRHTSHEQRKRLGIENENTFDYRVYLKDRKAPVGDAFGQWDGGELKKLFVAFQTESVRAFYATLSDEIDKHAGRHVAFSSNNYDGRWRFPYRLFDFGMAELPARSAKPHSMYEKFREARNRGKAQVFTFVSEEVALTRKVIATAYACGGHLIAPWDVYMPSKPRYYGKPADYADLYKFVRENAKFFDGYADAATVIRGTKDKRYDKAEPVKVTDHPDLYVWVRAVPGNADAPIVIHLVDWSKAPTGCRLVLRHDRFFGSGSLEVRLVRPGRKSLRLKTPATAGSTHLDVPAVNPWGLLVVLPGGAGN